MSISLFCRCDSRRSSDDEPRSRRRSQAIWRSKGGFFCILTTIIAHVLVASPMKGAFAADENALAGEAFEAATAGEWSRASKLIAGVRDNELIKAFRWFTLLESKAEIPFETLAAFAIENPGWPAMDDLRSKAEQQMTDPVDTALILRFFETVAPATVRGRIAYANALIATGDETRAVQHVKRAWIIGRFSAAEERRFQQRYGGYLTTADHDERLDALLWSGQRTAAARMFDLVSDGQAELAKARIKLQTHDKGVDQAIEAVPAALQNDAGLMFDRIGWRRQKGRDEGAIELLLDPPDEISNHENWWFERELQIRQALSEGDFKTAHQLAASHRQVSGSDYAQAAWLAGWLALRFAGEPASAYQRFVRMYDRVKPPVRQARAAYWAGRAAAAKGDQDSADDWYRRGAVHHSAYYGQLALAQIGGTPPLSKRPALDAQTIAAFEASELVQVTKALIAADADDVLEPFLKQLADDVTTGAEIGLIADLANEAGDPVLVARIGRYAAFRGKVNEAASFPVPAIDAVLAIAGGTPEPALLFGLARQESMFDARVSSSAGARGLMQLMPATANIVATELGLPYNAGRLTGDSNYNVTLGAHYLRLMLERFGGEQALALASYNAGPRRVDRWIERYGDPRTGDPYDMVDWIELIPFDETRNYVQRVLEGWTVYRRRLSETDLVMVNFPKINGPVDPPPAPLLKPIDVAATGLRGSASSDDVTISEQEPASTIQVPNPPPVDVVANENKAEADAKRLAPAGYVGGVARSPQPPPAATGAGNDIPQVDVERSFWDRLGLKKAPPL